MPDAELNLTQRLTEVRIDLDLLEDHITDVLEKIKHSLEKDPATGVPEIIQLIEQMLEELKADAN